MHATRIVTFLLGGWLFGTLFVDAIAYMNLRLPEEAISGAPPVAEKIIEDYGADQAGLLLHYFTGEANQLFLNRWGMIQVALGLLLIPAIYIATDHKLIPLIVAGLMLTLALLQFLTVAPEMAYRIRETAFPPGKGNVLLEARVLMLEQIFAATELVIVMAGCGLAAYVASYKSRRRLSKSAGFEVEALDRVK
jgi:hypothetical protein